MREAEPTGALHAERATPPSARRSAATHSTHAPRTDTRSVRGWRAAMAMAPAGVFALLPKAACPACWPVYAGALSALGLGFLLERTWMLPLTALFLALAVGSLAYRARGRRGYGPFAAGLAGALTILLGKFALESDPVTYGGLALLLGASLWNAWPVRKTATVSCPACASGARPNPSTRSLS